MGSKQLFIIEEAIFDTVEKLHYFLNVKNKEKYKLALETLELLCDDYKDLTGEEFYKNNEAVKFYEKLWEI